ncbi:SEC14 cytosolic factor [[Candida] jaroonii]|uniref:SEC14 cytosolic factor n=1 Tax=[Candida] jaroonii TaxID=467808 RepID=A0ACA9Y3Y1_9ASCO|nr:SEC14 cytosolic factor [[Candida] jaroonii]
MTTEEEILSSYPQISAPTEQTGYTSNLTDEQKVALEKLREELKSLGYEKRLDDSTLLRFLRARKFDLEKTKTMFIDCEKWRKEFGTDTILTDFQYTEKPLVAKFYPQYYHKQDKDGRPIYYEELGKVNLTEMLKFTSQERMLKNLVWEYEAFSNYRLPACSRKSGYLVETSCTIFDLKGLSLTTAYQVVTYVKEASKIGQDYYPERMGKFYCINAPFGFSTVFNLVKPWLDPVTVSKIFILGSSYKKDLLKQIDAENLPKKYGGTDDVHDQDLYLKDDGPWRDAKYIGPEGEAPKAF